MGLDVYLDRQRRRLGGTPKQKLRFWSRIATVAFVGLVGLVLFVGFMFAWYAKDLPRPDKVKRTEGLSTVILDRNGENLYDIFEDENRIPAQWQDIPEYLKNGTIAIEDKDFYTHGGLSRAGIIRAIFSTLFFGNMQGGSTLTQQLVKNVLLSQERTLPRKMKEAILSIQIERKYTKDEILQMYLNETPYGGTAVGVEAASKYYFNKPVKMLGLVESAILAGLPQSPSLHSPFTGEEKAYVDRTHHVLRRMREDGYISPIQETEASDQLEKVKFATADDSSLRAPHFVAYVKEQLIEKLGAAVVEAGGLTVTTSLDWKLQEKAQTIVAEEVNKAKSLKVSNGAAVIIDSETGEILTMVGSKDYQATDAGGFKFNVVTQGMRQPGSAIKPITYATAFKKGYTPSTMLLDVETKYPSGDPDKPEYNPKNYDNKYRGPVQLRFALANSINTTAVKLTALVGIRDVLKTAHELGISSLAPTDEMVNRLGLSLTLGGGEVTLLDLTSAFGVFGTGGFRQEPVSILKIVDNKSKVVFEQKITSPKRVLLPEVAYLITNILSDNESRKEIFGLRSHLVIPGRSIFVKTGTTDDKRDNWTIGGSTNRIVGVWVGNNDNSPMHTSLASGVTGAAPIWNRLIRETVKDIPNKQFERPSNIVEMEIDSYGGGLPVSDFQPRKEVFIKGTEPNGPASIYTPYKMSRKDGNKLANSVEVAKGEYDTKQFIVFEEKDPVSSDGKNRWQEGIDIWVATQGDTRMHPPGDIFQGGDQLAITIREPKNESQVNDNDLHVRADIGTSNEVTQVEIFVDGVVARTTTGTTISETISVTNGQHVVKVKAMDNKGNVSEVEAKIGVNEPYATPTPTP